MVVNYCRPLLKKKENVLLGKLWNLGVRYECYEVNDSKVVRNLSTRVVSDEEIQCLANGLDYGLIPKRVDKLMIASNIEQFYHRVTDITQHHKKFMNELKEAGAGAIVKSDVRVLNPKELTLAADLRSLTQSFLHKANEFRQQNNKLDCKEKNYRAILKKFREDDSIIITRSDKGRGIVEMNRQDYILQLKQKLLNDLLKRLYNEHCITDQFHSIAGATGSYPGRLYGLLKIHKENVPLRPVLSSIGTFNYGLAKALSQILSTIIEKKSMMRDSFDFVKEVRTLSKDFSKYRMVSFDVSSLYTNVPINETIEIILNSLYVI
ncbi:unnamed protein product [Rotaria magnacalcarata]|uniref:Reverse transcriptase domain-containing protein n=1 Tax=Rotaria magnacalcarata TaxID=392030 RepID=A0A8S2Z4G0_9BILA|nr:unnamed protein product [Rotaria magnacalcarata]CAF4602212.1 unnamed protein product [Rotaria magnacalcarata]